MAKRLGQWVRPGMWVFVVALLALVPQGAVSAPYAAMVIDARTGEVLHSRNADTRLHPASLTKMMTLYITFQAIENGEITLDTKVKVSRFAASEPPSKLGLKPGQRIALRYLIRAAAVKSANDAATALGEAIEGSEAAFARRMNRTAKSLGMTRTTFKNANGLTEAGHLSTARDMTTLGRHLFFDFPEYYNLFSRRSTNAGVRQVANTNRRFLAAYKGADGIKTGYTRAAGFNLVASAERGGERIIATMFGGTSTAARNKRVAELLDMGFARAPTRVAVVKPVKPAPVGSVLAVKTSLRPAANPRREAELVVAAADPIEATLQEALGDELGADVTAQVVTEAPETDEGADTAISGAVASALAAAGVQTQEVATDGYALTPSDPPAVASDLPRIVPRARPGMAALAAEPKPAVVTRLSTSGGRHWGINIGRYGSRYQAERVLLQTALTEIGTLDEALRKVVHKPTGFDANFVGLTEERAALACRRLAAREVECATFGPG